MNKSTKNIISVVVVVAIILSIWYLETKKPKLTSQLTDIILTNTVSDRDALVNQKAMTYRRAKEFVDPQGFINSPPFKLSDVVGKKVVLIDFWTYSCINCVRTLPYLNAWYEKYKDLGLEIICVHTPEFDFEKNYDNVSKAVPQLVIKYPVVLDSNMGTWNAYQNIYWPAGYLIDIDGFIVHHSIGEGSYAEIEKEIQKSLNERNSVLGITTPIPTSIVNPSDVIAMDQSKIQSPETYFGFARNEYLGNGAQNISGTQTLSIPLNIEPNILYLDGTWDFQDQYAENTSNTAKIVYKYNAKNVYFVASSTNGVPIKIFQDGKLMNTITIQSNKLYDLITGSDYRKHTLQIEVDGTGLQAFTFTFG